MILCGVLLTGALPTSAQEPAIGREPATEAVCDVSNEKCEGEESLALWVPPGTESWSVSDNEVRFRPPQGYVVWSKHQDGSFSKMEEGGITCECAEGDCSPVKRDGVYYCLVGPKCTSCCKRANSEAMMSLVVTPTEGTVRWATPEERVTLPLASPALLEVPEIQKAVRRFIRAAHNGRPQAHLITKENRGMAPEGYTLVPVNIYGYIANALVPKETAKTLKCEVEQMSAESGKYLDECGEAKDTCKCKSGSSGCKYWSSFGVSGCEAGACTSCSMSSGTE